MRPLNLAVALASVLVVGAMMALPAVAPARAASGQSATDLATSAVETTGAAVVQREHRPVTTEAISPEICQQSVVEGDTLRTIANFYHIRPETIAYNSGINDLSGIQVGDELRFPTVDGAIVEVKPGDTVEHVAARFGSDPDAVVKANRLVHEPENFAPGKSVIVPVPGAKFPNFEVRDTGVPRVSGIARGASSGAPSSRLTRPVNGYVTQFFHPGHLGVDLAAPYGAPVGASADGVVSASGWVPVGGLRVCVQHGSGLETCYDHTAVVYVSVGQQVARGEALAAVGLTGVTTGPHVHWEAKLNAELVNPLVH